MPQFYLTPETKKILLEKSCGDLRHPVIDQFCQAYVNEYIKIERNQSIKRTIIFLLFTVPVLLLCVVAMFWL